MWFPALKDWIIGANDDRADPYNPLDWIIGGLDTARETVEQAIPRAAGYIDESGLGGLAQAMVTGGRIPEQTQDQLGQASDAIFSRDLGAAEDLQARIAASSQEAWADPTYQSLFSQKLGDSGQMFAAGAADAAKSGWSMFQDAAPEAAAALEGVATDPSFALGAEGLSYLAAPLAFSKSNPKLRYDPYRYNEYTPQSRQLGYQRPVENTQTLGSFMPLNEAVARSIKYDVAKTKQNLKNWMPDVDAIVNRTDIGPLKKSVLLTNLTGGVIDYFPKGDGKWEPVYVINDNTWIQDSAGKDDWMAPNQDPDTPIGNTRGITVGERAAEANDPFILEGAQDTEQFQLVPELLNWRIGPSNSIKDQQTNGYASPFIRSIFLNRNKPELGDAQYIQPFTVEGMTQGGSLPSGSVTGIQKLVAHEMQHGMAAHTGMASGSNPGNYMDAPFSEKPTRDKIFNIFETLGPVGAKATLDDMVKNTKPTDPEFDHIMFAAEIADDAVNSPLDGYAAHNYSVMMGGPDAEYLTDLGEVGARAMERQLVGGNLLGNGLWELARANEYVPEGLSVQGIQHLKGSPLLGPTPQQSMFEPELTGTLRTRRPEEPNGTFDPRYVYPEEQIMYGDDGKTVIAVSDLPRLKNPEEAKIPEPSWPPADWRRPDMFEIAADPTLDRNPPEPEFIFRAMSADEYDAFKKNGYIQSNGSYNIGDEQKGLTYFTKSPESAVSYASGFAPKGHTPGADRPAYIVKIKNVGPDRQKIVRGTAEHEVGVKGKIPASDVVGVYRGDVVANIPETSWRNERNVLRWSEEESPNPSDTMFSQNLNADGLPYGVTRDELEEIKGNFGGMIQNNQHGYTPDQAAMLVRSANQQRGAPERQMVKLQHTKGIPATLSSRLEHVGDLTHRMMESYAVSSTDHGLEFIAPKVRNAYHDMQLTGRPFSELVAEGLNSNSEFYDLDPAEVAAKLEPELEKYGDLHSEIRVYNRVQELARNAAVALGYRDYKGAKAYLGSLKRIIEDGEYPELIKEFDPNYDDDYQQRVKARKRAKARGEESYWVRPLIQ